MGEKRLQCIRSPKRGGKGDFVGEERSNLIFFGNRAGSQRRETVRKFRPGSEKGFKGRAVSRVSGRGRAVTGAARLKNGMETTVQR